MDSFTEKILTRARERQKMLEVYTISDEKNNYCSDKKLNKQENLSDPTPSLQASSSLFLRDNLEGNLPRACRQNSRTRMASDISGSPKAQLKTLNIQQDNLNMEIKVTSTEDVRVEIEIEQDGEIKRKSLRSPKSECGLRDKSKKTLKQLGKLYSGDDADISSPIHRSEAKFYENDTNDNQFKCNERYVISKPSGNGLQKLAQLAEVINQWENDGFNPLEKKIEVDKANKLPNENGSKLINQIKNKQKDCALQPPALESSVKTNYGAKEKENLDSILKEKLTQINTSEISNKTRSQSKTPYGEKNNWDKGILDSLESQGFTRTDSNSRLVYSYSTKKKQANVEIAQKSVTQKNSKFSAEKEVQKCYQFEDSTSTSISSGSNIATKFGNVINVLNKFPNSHTEGKMVCVPSSPTKHIKSANITDKAAVFEKATPVKATKDPALLSVSERKALFEKNKSEVLMPKASFHITPPDKVDASSIKIIPSNESVSNKLNIDKMIKNSNENDTKTPNKYSHIKILNKTDDVLKTHENIRNQYEKSDPNKIGNTKPIVHDVTSKYIEENNSTSKGVAQQSGGIASIVAALMQNKSTISEAQIANSIKSQRQKEMDILLNRFNKKSEVSHEVIVEEESENDYNTAEENAVLHQEDLKIDITKDTPTRNSAEKRKSGSQICSTEDSPRVAAILQDVKKIKVSPAKVGRLYPNLSDIEAATGTETDIQSRASSPENQQSSYSEDNTESDDEPNTSFSRDILEAVCKNNLSSSKRPVYDDSTASDLSSILEDSNYPDELRNEDNAIPGPTPPKLLRQKTPQNVEMQPSNSFSYKSFNTSNKCLNKSKNDIVTPLKLPIRKSNSELPAYVVEGDNVLPLTYTVSFYRKQQNQSQTPVRQITKPPSVEKSSESDAISEETEVVKKIIEMQEEVHKQQNIISQTSQALNLCSSTLEFSGSTEQVEAEKVLLLATHRRQAALHELQRLKIEKTLRSQSQQNRNLPLEKGTLSISNIVLPLKQKYVKALAAAGGKGHHVVCLIKCGEQVVSTKLVSTVISNVTNPDIELSIPGTILLKNIYSDFTVTFEVYCLQAQEEFLPHEVKYHINTKVNNKLVTPKKSKQDSRMVMPFKESPAGPQAVRSSSFALMGYIVFSVQAINKKAWSLNNTPPMSPIDGTVEMCISYELALSVEHRGFLTMFEDVSGFGAWHRRWCLLKQQTLSYWKYPDDEKKMAPIDTINLRDCITKNVGPISRDICARLHTFLIETERNVLPHDKDSLVTVMKGDKTVIRHLLSADTKEERIEWCTKFNAVLTALQMWGKSQ